MADDPSIEERPFIAVEERAVEQFGVFFGVGKDGREALAIECHEHAAHVEDDIANGRRHGTSSPEKWCNPTEQAQFTEQVESVGHVRLAGLVRPVGRAQPVELVLS